VERERGNYFGVAFSLVGKGEGIIFLRFSFLEVGGGGEDLLLRIYFLAVRERGIIYWKESSL
jgi:hypothetical protein